LHTENQRKHIGSWSATETNPGIFQVCRWLSTSGGRHSNRWQQTGGEQGRSHDDCRLQCTHRSYTMSSNILYTGFTL